MGNVYANLSSSKFSASNTNVIANSSAKNKDDITNMDEDQFIAYYNSNFSSQSEETNSSKLEVIDMDTNGMAKLRKSMNIYEPQKNDDSWINIFSTLGKNDRDAILHRSLNLPTSSMSKDQINKNIFSLFDRYYSINPDVELSGLCHYVFMTRPDLNICNANDVNYTIREEVANHRNQFNSVWHTNPEVIRSLIKTGFGDHEFIPIITSRVESLQLPDYSLRTYMIEQPFSGYSMPISGHGIHSTTGGQFDLTIRETSDLALHKLFQLWTGYINDINLGKYRPKNDYIRENRCDYAVSVYDIVCAPDGKTILFWVKYVGAFPINVPTSDLSFNRGGGVNNQFTITFDYFLAEFMDKYSLFDFNINSGKTSLQTMTDRHQNYNAGPNRVNGTIYDGYSTDGISVNNDQTSGNQTRYYIPIYGMGDSLYKRPYINFHYNVKNQHSGTFPTLGWEK